MYIVSETMVTAPVVQIVKGWASVVYAAEEESATEVAYSFAIEAS